jgi:external thioesterase TEII
MKKTQLFLLHFAGGNRYSFQFLLPYLKSFDVIPLELPGRGRRMGEPLLRKFDVAAQDMYDQIIPKITSPDFMIYGHSMGAYLGLRVSVMLEAAGKTPAYLFVSGNAGPGMKEGDRSFLLNRQDFADELKRLGGIPEEFLADDELFELFEPILRADFEIADRSALHNEKPTSAPLFAMMGNLEEDVNDIANWGNYTKSTFASEVMEGGHFFIHKHPARIAGIIRSCYDKTILFQHQ